MLAERERARSRSSWAGGRGVAPARPRRITAPVPGTRAIAGVLPQDRPPTGSRALHAETTSSRPRAEPATRAHRDATERGLRHLLHGEIEPREARYRVVAGQYPNDLGGRVFTTVFAREAVFDRHTLAAAPHLLSSPGRMLYVDLDPRGAGEPYLRVGVRPIETPSSHLRALFPSSFARAGMVEVGWLGVSDLGNTTPLPVFPDARGGVRLVVAYDAGRPLEIDPRAFSMVGPVGHATNYRSCTGGTFGPVVLTSGHPVYDPAFPLGPRLLIANLMPRVTSFFTPNRPIASELHLVTWDGEGPPTRPIRVTEGGRPLVLHQASAHQMLVTRRYVIIVNASLVIDAASMLSPMLGALFARLSSHATGKGRSLADDVAARVRGALPGALPRADTDIFVIAKDELSSALRDGRAEVSARRFVLPREVTHAVADHDDDGERIVLFCQTHPGTDHSDPIEAGEALVGGGAAAAEFAGMFAHATDLNYVARHTLDLRDGSVATKVFPEVGDDEAFPFGVNLLPPVTLSPYRVRGDGEWDLAGCAARWDATFWVAGGYHPATMSARIFARYSRERTGSARAMTTAAYLERVQRTDATSRLFALDRDLRLLGSYAFPPGHYMATPAFAPRPRAASVRDGYLVGQVWTADRPGVELWIFDTARPLDRGPVCKLAAEPGEQPLSPGFPLHAAWMEARGVSEWTHPPTSLPPIDLPTYVKAGELASFVLGLARHLADQVGGRGT